MKIEKQIVGNIGLYYACYKLSCMGWNVMPTSRNTKGIDIVAIDESGKAIQVQVKTLSNRSPVPLGKNLDNIMGDYWVIINNVSKDPNAFIMESKKVKPLAHRNERNGNISYWLEPSSYDTQEFREAWDRIGRGHG